MSTNLRDLQDLWRQEHTENALSAFRHERVNRPRTMYALTQLGWRRHEAKELIARVIAEKRAVMLTELAHELATTVDNGKT